MLFVGALGCTKEPPSESPSPPVRSASKAEKTADEGFVVLEDNAPLQEGLVVFEGTVRPTKGGFNVRGVTLDGGETPGKVRVSDALKDKGVSSYDGLMGAKLRVTAALTLQKEVETREIVQSRGGSWFHAERVVAIELVAWPQVIEGPIGRSKGFFTVGQFLVTREDLHWALAPSGEEDGVQVRLWGQPRIVVCEPNAQCLLSGSLPIFDVGRAQKLAP